MSEGAGRSAPRKQPLLSHHPVSLLLFLLLRGLSREGSGWPAGGAPPEGAGVLGSGSLGEGRPADSEGSSGLSRPGPWPPSGGAISLPPLPRPAVATGERIGRTGDSNSGPGTAAQRRQWCPWQDSLAGGRPSEVVHRRSQGPYGRAAGPAWRPRFPTRVFRVRERGPGQAR